MLSAEGHEVGKFGGVMGDMKYAAFSIPAREVGTHGNKPQSAQERGAAASAYASGTATQLSASFAEVEIECKPKPNTGMGASVSFFPYAAPPEAITRKPVDPMRQRFYDMRSLAANRPFARNDSELFRRQAKFMEDIEDDYPGEAKLNMYYPYYQHMGYEQLRTYFTWRTKMRKGEMLPISAPYAFLYTYELLSNIGVESPADGLAKLTAMLTEYSAHAPVLERYLPKWIKDYHIYYELPDTFEDYIKKHCLYRQYAELFLFDEDVENRLELWSGISDYSIAESKFFADGNEQMLSDCFDAVFYAIRDYYAKRNARIEDLMVYRISNRTPWDPFSQALFHPWLSQPDRKLKLPGNETYYCRNNRWTASLPMYLSSKKNVAEYLVRKTESCLREAVKYKQGMIIGKRLRNLVQEQTDALDAVIEKAVADFHKHINRTVVTVDHANLSRIREESLGTLSKLIVPEDDGQPAIHSTVLCPPKHLHRHSEPDPLPHAGLGWDELKEALSGVEMEALRIILEDSNKVRAYADESSIMLEVLADGINEKAADIIGDSILEADESSLMIYDDYRNSVLNMLRG